MMNQTLKKLSALVLILTFPLTQTGWGADAIQLVDGRLQPVSDPLSAQTSTVQATAEPVDFFSASDPLSLPEEPALPPARISFSSTSGLTTASVTALPGSPRPYLMNGSTAETVIQNPSSNIIQMNYKTASVSQFSGLDVSFDNASTAAVETISISGLSNLTFGLKGDAPTVRLQIEDIKGAKDEIDLSGVSSVTEKFWRISVSALSSTLDKTKIKSIRFVVSPSNANLTAADGKLFVRARGLNLNAPSVPVVTSSVPAFTNLSTVTLSGTKEANTAILINGVEVIARDASTTWSAAVALPAEGTNSFSITAKNTLGKISTAKVLSLTKDTVIPTGTININSGALYATSSTVTLNLSATDNKSGVGTMSFSTDGVNWSAAETYKTSKSFTLPEGDGNKTVFVKYFDKAGNASPVYSKSITLDLAPPTGGLTVNGGVSAINQTAVVLNLSATDAGSGLSKMSFSTNNSTWTTAENYAATKNWSFTAGDGNKIVYAKFQDKTGKWSAPVSVTVLMDTSKPTGSIRINSDAVFTNSQNITLNLLASDTGSGAAKMSFSTDNLTWTAPETYSVSKNFELSSGDGNKTVFVKYFDQAGNASAVYSQSIILDSAPPEASVVLDQGKPESNQTQMQAVFSASDAGAGLGQVRFSLDDGLSWSDWQNFKENAVVDFMPGDGEKKIRYEARDAAGNIASVSDTIILDQTAPVLRLLSVATLVHAAAYTVEYFADGLLKSKSYTLEEGLNHLALSEIDHLGNTAVLNWDVDYQTSWDLPLSGGGVQHFQSGKLQYQIFADGSRVDYEADETVAGYQWGAAGAYAAVFFSNDAPGLLEIRDVSGHVLKSVAADKPVAPDLSGAVKVNLQNGVEAYYAGGVLKEVRTGAGVRLFDLTMSVPASAEEAPEILGAVVAYPNGSFDVMWNKQLVRAISNTGAVTDFLPSGKIAREIQGSTEQTHVEFYDATGNFAGTRVFSSAGGEVIYDEKGILKEARGGDGKHFIYDRTAEGGLFLIELNPALSSAASPETLRFGRYSQSGEIAELEFQNGSRVLFENGQMKRAYDAEGGVTDYNPSLLNGVPAGLLVSRDSATFQYDDDGFLSRIQTAQGTIVREQVDSNADGVLTDDDTVNLLLEWAGAYRLTEFELDAEGKILNGLIETREGIKQKIENGALKEFETADGRKYIVENQEARLEEWKFKDGLVVKYGGVGINEVLFPDGKKLTQIGLTAAKEIEKYTETFPDGTQKFYENGWLVKLVSADGVQILYGSDHRAGKVILADKTEKQIEHQWDASGNWIGLKVRDGDSVFSYDADAKLTGLLISGLYADVQDGEIGKVFTRFGEISSPAWNAQGQMEGEINLSDGRKLTLSGGKLTRVTMPDGAVVDYENGRISRVDNSEGIYNLTYLMSGDRLQDIKVNWTLKSTAPFSELITESVPLIFEGDAKPASDAEKFGSYLTLDGSGDYLSVSDSPDWDFGTGDFTIDFNFFQNKPVYHGEYFFTKNGELDLRVVSGRLYLYRDGLPTDMGVWTDQVGAWRHIALVRLNGVVSIYLDGQLAGRQPFSKDIQGNAAFNFGNGQLGGAIDELRISSVARWTSDFTPPEQEYSIDANTLFLHHFQQLGKFNSKYDGQPLNVQTTSVTAMGDAAVISGAVLFDGAGDYLKIPGMNGMSFGGNDFTIESRVKVDTVSPATQTIVAEYADGGLGWIFLLDPRGRTMMFYRDGWTRATVSLNAGTQFSPSDWNDIAAVRVGNKIKFFLNGVQQGSDYDVSGWVFNGSGSNFKIGQYGTNDSSLKGAMDWIRISKGIGRYSQNYAVSPQGFAPDEHTLLLHHFDSLSPAQSVPSPVIASAGGDAKVYAPRAVLGDAVYLDGKGDAIKSYDPGLLSFGKKDFTLDMRVNFEQARDGERYTLLSRGDGMEFRFMRETNNRLELYLMGSVYDFDFFKPETGRWYQLALVRKNGQLKLYVDGVANSVQFSAPQDMVFSDASPTKIGAWYSDNRNAFAGSMDELRISDIARWDANFTPPAAEYQIDKNTRFLHHFNDLDRAESGREILKYGIIPAGEIGQGPVSQISENSKFGSAGLNFNAVNQTLIKVPEINFKNSDYTVEGWFKSSSSVLSGAGLFGQQNSNVTNYAGLYVGWDGKLTYEIRRNSQNLITLSVPQTINYAQMHHYAVVKDGSVVKIFVDGALSAQGTVSDIAMPDFTGVDFTLGKYSFSGYTTFYGWTGAVDEFRVSDRARYQANFSVAAQAFEMDADTLFLHHGEGQGLRAAEDFKQPSGEMSLARYLLKNPDSGFSKIISSRPVDDLFQGNAAYQLQSSFAARSFTVSGDTVSSPDGQSFLLDGAGDGIAVAGDDFNFGTNDFTLEANVAFNRTNGFQTIASDYGAATGWIWDVDFASKWVHFYHSGQGRISFMTGDWILGKNYELSIVRKGNQLMFFRDGVMEGGVQVPAAAYNGYSGAPLWIGSYGNEAWLSGSMNRLRITKNLARYAQNYSVPAAYSRDSGTELLLEFSAQENRALSEVIPPPGDPAVLGRIDLSSWVKDSERGGAYAVSGIFDPNLKNIYAGDACWNGSYLSRNCQLTASDHIPPLQTDLVDMDGDGDLDRIYAVDTVQDYWMIQRFENGKFLAPEKWTGIKTLPGDLHYNQYTLRFYEGRHPVTIGDLVDINGDGRPDRVMVSVYGGREWYVQLNNGHGFEAAEIWSYNPQPLSQWNYQASYALRVRDDTGEQLIQPLTSDLVDLDGDGLLDRVARPLASPTPRANPYDHWFFQKNNGHGFDDALIWEGVDAAFDADPKIGSAISWNTYDGSVMADTADLVDMNGDHLPDRILLKPKTAGRPDLGYNWHIQFNNGHGFDSAVLWDSSVRSLPGLANLGAASAIRAFHYSNYDRSYFSFLEDVTGDGLPDRISIDSLSTPPANRWWVEENTGTTFQPAVAWEGIEGATLQEISPTQDNQHFVSYSRPGLTGKMSNLVDMNQDGKLDRVIFKQQTNQWLVQYGTGSGFLPSRTMEIQSVSAEAITDHYEYVHVSLRSDDAALSQTGKLVVKLLDANDAVVQTWDIEKPGSEWKDHYLKLDAAKTNGRFLSMEWQFDAGTSQSAAPQILVEDAGLTVFRPDASLEWLDYLLTDAALVDQVHAAANDSLIGKLGGLAGAAGAFDWKTLLSADKRITFNAEGAISGTEKLNGETTTVTGTENGSIITTTRSDGTVTQTVVPADSLSSAMTQTIVNDNGTPNDITDDYTETATIAYDRVRSVTREKENKRPLQYSYEFDSLGREMTAIYDPDSKTTERYRVFETPNGKESKLIIRVDANGVETRFEYDDQARLTASVIYYKGRERERFTHLETGNNQSSVRLDNGTVETYDSQGRILSHTTIEGYTYAHEFAPQRDAVTTVQTETFVICDPAQEDCSAIPVNERTLTFDIPYIELVPCTVNCEEIHRVSLDSFTDLNGSRATYDGSQVATVSLKDGTVILIHAWIESVHAQTSGRSYSPKEVTVIHADGSITEFKNGKPFSVATSSGRVIDIQPDLSVSGAQVPVLVNASSAAEFHYAEAVKLWNDLVLVQVQKFAPPSDLPVETEYTKQGVVLNRLFAEGSRQIFDTAGKLTDIYAESGAAWAHYDYDQNGKLIDIDLDGSRRDLDLRASELRAQMAVEKQKALSLAAEREQVLNETIEGEYLVQRDRLLQLKSQVESQKSKLISVPARGSARGIIAGAMNQIQAGLAQINRALTQLAEQRAQSLADVSVAARDLKARIEAESAAGMADIADKEAEIQKNILKQEISPVVFEWYRAILGRHPSDIEYDAEVARADYATGSLDAAALKARLEASPEKAARLAEVNAIKTSVRNQLQSYLTMTAEQKTAYQTSLGLGGYSDFVVSLSESEVQKILSWLDGGSLHFGQSAFIALEAMLDDADVTHNRIDLARDLIMMDILTGTITELERGDLVLSMFSLNLYAKRFGLNLSPLELNWDSLKSLVVSLQSSVDAQKRVIAHIDGNHYIIITNITTRVVDGKTIEEVHYTDPGAGPESDLDQLVLNKEDFLEVWSSSKSKVSGLQSSSGGLESGYILAPRAPPSDLSLRDQGEAISHRTLTTPEQMQIRGAFFPIIFVAIAAVIAAIVSAVASVVAAIIAVIVSVVAAITAVIGSLVTFVGTLFGSQFLIGLGAMFQGFSLTIANVGAAIVASSLPSTIASALVFGYGLQGIGNILTAVGVDPKISGTIIAGGKLIGGIALTATGAGAGLGLSLIGSGTTDLLSLHTNLSSSAISMISLGSQVLGSFAGGLGGPGGFSWADGLALLKTSIPSLAMDLSATGIEMLGNSLGWDPRITGLASFAVGATVGGIGSGVTNGKSFLESINLGLKQGVAGAVSYGVNLGLNEVGVPSIASGFLSGLLGGMIGGALGGSNSTVGSKEEAGQSLLGRITDNVKKFGQGIMKAVGGVISFGADVLQRGYEAVKNTFTGLFSRETQEVLYGASTAGGVGVGAGWVKVSYTENFDANDNLTSVVEIYQNGAGDKVTMVGGLQTGNFTIQRQMANGDFFQEVYEGVGRGTNGGFSYSKVAFADELSDGVKIDSSFVAGQNVDLTIVDPNKLKFRVVRLNPGEQVLPVSVTEEGIFYNVPVRGADQYFSFTGNGFWNDPAVSKTGIADLSKRFMSDITADQISSGEVPIPLVGRDGLVARDRDGNILTAASLPLTLYENTNWIGGNALLWGKEVFGGNSLSGKMEQELRSYFELIEYNKQQYGLQNDQFHYTHFAHSGNFVPMLEVLDRNPTMPISTLISYEGPDLLDRTIHNPNLDRIIQVRGTQGNLGASPIGALLGGGSGSVEWKDMGPPFLQFREYKGVDESGNVRSIKNIHIEILGARHNDFDYHPDDPDPVFREVSRKTNLFMRELQQAAAVGGNALTDFLSLNRDDGAITKKDGKYIVDPTKFKSRLNNQ